MSSLLYIHGLNSSPQSDKAQQTRQWLQQNAPHITFHCPHLPPFGDAAISTLRELVEQNLTPPVYLIGSSMGGFFATVLAEEYDLRAVLINPAVGPARGLHRWLGEHENYHTGEKWILKPHHVEEYQSLDPGEPQRKNNYLVLLQTGDEVLDYRDAVKRYTGCRMILEQGGDHSFVGYLNHLNDILSFLTDPATIDPSTTQQQAGA